MDGCEALHVGYLQENTEDHGHRIHRNNVWALLFNMKQIKRGVICNIGSDNRAVVLLKISLTCRIKYFNN